MDKQTLQIWGLFRLMMTLWIQVTHLLWSQNERKVLFFFKSWQFYKRVFLLVTMNCSHKDTLALQSTWHEIDFWVESEAWKSCRQSANGRLCFSSLAPTAVRIITDVKGHYSFHVLCLYKCFPQNYPSTQHRLSDLIQRPPPTSPSAMILLLPFDTTPHFSSLFVN